MTQIHSLIFCGSHNLLGQVTQGLSPVTQIMKNFYGVTDSLSRPRILALVSFSANDSLLTDSLMLDLEDLFDSKILGLTSTSREDILAKAKEPREMVLPFPKTTTSGSLALLDRILTVDPTESLFQEHHKVSRLALIELGHCAAALVWRRAQKEISYLALKTEDIKAASINEIIRDWSFTMPNLDCDSRGFNVTHKFRQLVNVLEAFEPYKETFRGIIFGMAVLKDGGPFLISSAKQ
jgi:endoribonuclease Dicer